MQDFRIARMMNQFQLRFLSGAVVCLAMFTHGQLFAQSSEPKAFEVASIKPADPDSHRVMIQLTPGGGFNATGMALKQLIAMAYEIPCGRSCDNLIVGGPAGMDSWAYDIVAKGGPAEAAPPPNTPESRRLMQAAVREKLRALLAERFQLTTHRETKELPVYALVVGKSGHKLKESEAQGPQMVRMGPGQFTAQSATMEMLGNNLAAMLGRPVQDRTGLKGTYEIKLEYTPDRPTPAPGGEGGATSDNGPSLFSALQEQLGLKLESTKGPVSQLVIDHVEKPSAN